MPNKPPSPSHPQPQSHSTSTNEQPLTDQDLLEGAKDWVHRIGSGRETFDAPILHNCHVLSARMTPVPTVIFELEVGALLENGGGNFHGGAITTTFDNLTTCPLFLTSRPGMFQFGGVSRNLNVSFLRPVPVGTKVVVECSVVSMGRRLALLRGEMRRKEDGVLVATCLHDKVNTDPGVNEKL